MGVPAELSALVESADAVFECALLLAVAHVGISEWGQTWLHFSKFVYDFQGFGFAVEHHEGAGQECCIRSFVVIRRAPMYNLEVGELGIR